MKNIVFLFLFTLGSIPLGWGSSRSDWVIDVQSRSHGVLRVERWEMKSSGIEKTLTLQMSSGQSVLIPVTSEEIDFLSYDLAPLSIKKKRFLEIGLCSQFFRIKTEFGSRKFCQKQIARLPKLAEVINRLEIYRKKALGSTANP